RPRQCAAEWLADDPHWRRFGVLAQRHGRVRGRAPGPDRDTVLQVRACGRARPPHPVLRGDGGQELDLRPARRDLSRHAGRHHRRKGRRVEGGRAGALPGPATHPGHTGGCRARAGRAPVGRAAARDRRQGDGLLARRGRGSRLHRALEKREWVYPKDMPWHAAIAEKAAANAAQIAPQLVDDAAPANYYRALSDIAAWAPEDAIIIGEGASMMDIGRTQLPNAKPRHRLD